MKAAPARLPLASGVRFTSDAPTKTPLPEKAIRIANPHLKTPKYMNNNDSVSDLSSCDSSNENENSGRKKYAGATPHEKVAAAARNKAILKENFSIANAISDFNDDSGVKSTVKKQLIVQSAKRKVAKTPVTETIEVTTTPKIVDEKENTQQHPQQPQTAEKLSNPVASASNSESRSRKKPPLPTDLHITPLGSGKPSIRRSTSSERPLYNKNAETPEMPQISNDSKADPVADTPEVVTPTPAPKPVSVTVAATTVPVTFPADSPAAALPAALPAKVEKVVDHLAAARALLKKSGGVTFASAEKPSAFSSQNNLSLLADVANSPVRYRRTTPHPKASIGAINMSDDDDDENENENDEAEEDSESIARSTTSQTEALVSSNINGSPTEVSPTTTNGTGAQILTSLSQLFAGGSSTDSSPASAKNQLRSRPVIMENTSHHSVAKTIPFPSPQSSNANNNYITGASEQQQLQLHDISPNSYSDTGITPPMRNLTTLSRASSFKSDRFKLSSSASSSSSISVSAAMQSEMTSSAAVSSSSTTTTATTTTASSTITTSSAATDSADVMKKKCDEVATIVEKELQTTAIPAAAIPASAASSSSCLLPPTSSMSSSLPLASSPSIVYGVAGPCPGGLTQQDGVSLGRGPHVTHVTSRMLSHQRGHQLTVAPGIGGIAFQVGVKSHHHQGDVCADMAELEHLNDRDSLQNTEDINSTGHVVEDVTDAGYHAVRKPESSLEQPKLHAPTPKNERKCLFKPVGTPGVPSNVPHINKAMWDETIAESTDTVAAAAATTAATTTSAAASSSSKCDVSIQYSAPQSPESRKFENATNCLSPISPLSPPKEARDKNGNKKHSPVFHSYIKSKKSSSSSSGIDRAKRALRIAARRLRVEAGESLLPNSSSDDFDRVVSTAITTAANTRRLSSPPTSAGGGSSNNQAKSNRSKRSAFSSDEEVVDELQESAAETSSDMDDMEFGLGELLLQATAHTLSQQQQVTTSSSSSSAVPGSSSTAAAPLRATPQLSASALRLKQQKEQQDMLSRELSPAASGASPFVINATEGKLGLSSSSGMRSSAMRMTAEQIQAQLEQEEREMAVQEKQQQQQQQKNKKSAWFGAEESVEYYSPPTAAPEYSVRTDAAVKTGDSILTDDVVDAFASNTSAAGNISALDASSAAWSVANTTLTLDHSYNNAEGDEYNVLFDGKPAPVRMALKSMKRASDAVADIKEITFQTHPGQFTTVLLAFSNQQKKPITLRAQAIQIRFENFYQSLAEFEGDENGPLHMLPTENCFQVSPSKVRLQPGEEANLYVTFSPPAAGRFAAGLHSGVLKIQSSRKKSYVLLLRGEARNAVSPAAAASDNNSNNNAKDVSIMEAVKIASFGLNGGEDVEEMVPAVSSSTASPAPPASNSNSMARGGGAGGPAEASPSPQSALYYSRSPTIANPPQHLINATTPTVGVGVGVVAAFSSDAHSKRMRSPSLEIGTENTLGARQKQLQEVIQKIKGGLTPTQSQSQQQQQQSNNASMTTAAASPLHMFVSDASCVVDAASIPPSTAIAPTIVDATQSSSPAAAVVVVRATQQPQLSNIWLSGETVEVEPSYHNRHVTGLVEGSLTMANTNISANAQEMRVVLKSSSVYVKLSKTVCLIKRLENESIRIMLDTNSLQFRAFARDQLSAANTGVRSPAHPVPGMSSAATHTVLGYVTLEVGDSSGEEYTVDVTISLLSLATIYGHLQQQKKNGPAVLSDSALQHAQQQHNYSQSFVADENFTANRVYEEVASNIRERQQRTMAPVPIPAPAPASTNAAAYANVTTTQIASSGDEQQPDHDDRQHQQRSSTKSTRSHSRSRTSRSHHHSHHHHEGHNAHRSAKATAIMLNSSSASIAANTSYLMTTQYTEQQQQVSAPTLATAEKRQYQAFDTSIVSPITQSNVHETPMMMHNKSTAMYSMSRHGTGVANRSTAGRNNSRHHHESPKGVFFRKQSVNFGSVAAGSLTRMKVELCNATEEEVLVYLGDPSLPFVLLHNEVRLRPRSYVRVPVRFLPVHSQDYYAELMAQTADGEYHTSIKLSGTAL